ncbi:hypothetical protein [Streptomyces sp. NBC_01744]|uniref:hypothetical protein n=1 Tax=Streptomyces sp. NBC_01744 TaxID=2975927 RepID=UPI003D9A9045|nr:hypothetical protein OIE70_02255 [Streptomyces sp. NBC_01744]
MPYGQPWRVPPKRPYGTAALSISATVLKGFYLHQCVKRGINNQLREALDVSRLSTTADRKRAFLGHVKTSMPANPLAPPNSPRRRHPKMLPDGARPELLGSVNTARDEMVVTWLSDSSLRIGGLTGLHLVDLHLRENADCGECKSPHVHVCHRQTNPNRARAKKKEGWSVTDGVVCGGEIYRASPAMVSSYFKYMTTEYAKHATGHGMLLIQLSGPTTGEPWTADAARGMLRRAVGGPNCPAASGRTRSPAVHPREGPGRHDAEGGRRGEGAPGLLLNQLDGHGQPEVRVRPGPRGAGR